MIRNFAEYCLANIDHSFGQNFQDLFGLWVAGGSRTGYFVEFGALNGREYSNSFLLEKLGWNGIVAEPHPNYADRVQAVRNCHFSPLCVYDTTGDTVKFRMVVGRPAMSGLAETQLNSQAEHRNKFREVEIGTITLNDLLEKYEAPQEVDFISIDTEGSELRILKAFDFSQRFVKSFCIEHNYEQRTALADLMFENGYKRWFTELSAHDDWWIHQSIAPEGVAADYAIGSASPEKFEANLENRRAGLEKFLTSL